LFFPSSTSYLRSDLNLKNYVNAYTLEFWFKASSGLLGENYMISLDEKNSRPVRQILTILQEIDGLLACFPNLPKTQNKVKYYDYDPESRSWIHIACIYDG
jgi:hypothetical protein